MSWIIHVLSALIAIENREPNDQLKLLWASCTVLGSILDIYVDSSINILKDVINKRIIFIKCRHEKIEVTTVKSMYSFV